MLMKPSSTKDHKYRFALSRKVIIGELRNGWEARLPTQI
jgi:hypothetical protein